MKKMKLTKDEIALEGALMRGEFKPISSTELSEIASAIERRKKDAVLNIRINRHDLKSIQEKAKKLKKFPTTSNFLRLGWKLNIFNRLLNFTGQSSKTMQKGNLEKQKGGFFPCVN